MAIDISGKDLENNTERQISDNRTLVSRIASYIPMYKGYKQRQLRREEDRAIRDVVAKELVAVKNDLANSATATVGDLEAMRQSERLRAKVDKYYSQVKKTATGYTGFHEAVKIRETELDRVITYDAQLIEGVEALKKETVELTQYADTGEDIKVPMRLIERDVDKLIENFNQRDAIMKGIAAEQQQE